MPAGEETTCCIAGGGPAGMMLGYLLARAGIDVIVLEKHNDFLRDFRGDTVHPSTLEILYELGLIDEFLARPHTKVAQLSGVINGHEVSLVDFTHLPTHCKYIVLMPQWDFLDFLASKARAFPNFHLWMNARAEDVIAENGLVKGVVVETGEGKKHVHCDLVIAADGRNSILREKAGLEIQDFGAPIDVLWLRVGKGSSTRNTFGHIAAGRIVVTLDRGDYWQVAYVIPKGAFNYIRQRGLERFRNDLVELAPQLSEHVDDVQSWDDVKLLTVRVDRLKRWYKPGFLCIGDAAHAMSPIGGVGINLAIQDAVAAANILSEPLKERNVNDDVLGEVQKRRELPTRLTQSAQLFIQQNVISGVLQSDDDSSVPLVVRVLNRWPRLRRIPARLVGLGVRPEHVKTRGSFQV